MRGAALGVVVWRSAHWHCSRMIPLGSSLCREPRATDLGENACAGAWVSRPGWRRRTGPVRAGDNGVWRGCMSGCCRLMMAQAA